jgi:hypothetical protein
LVLSVVAAAVCMAAGVSWALVREIGSFGLLLMTLSLLGGSALAAAGWWQRVAGAETRVFVIVLLAALSGGYVAASVVGVLVAPNIGYALGGFPPLAVVRVLSWVGLIVGGTLYLGTLAAGIPALRARGRALAGEDRAS